MPQRVNTISPLDLQYQIKRRGWNQRRIAKNLKVTEGAISGAINNDPLLKNLRIRILHLLNSTQTSKSKSVEEIKKERSA